MKQLIALCALLCAAAAYAGGLEVSPNPATAAPGSRLRFTAPDAPGPVAWRVIPGRLGTIDGAGLFTASNLTGSGVVRAVSAGPDGVERVGHAAVRVVDDGRRRLSVTVFPRQEDIRIGGSASFSAEASGPEGVITADAAVSWRVVPETLGDISAAGVFTARAPGEGRVVAVARSGDARGMGQARIRVAAAAAAGQPAVSLSPRRASVAPGGTQLFTASFTGPVGAAEAPRFEVDPPWLGTIDASGLFTAGAEPGTGVVRAIAAGGASKALVTVRSEGRTLTVRLTPRQVSLRPGQAVQFDAQAFDREGLPVPVAGWRWRVVPERLGTVTPNGLFTAPGRSGSGRVVAQLPASLGTGSDAAVVVVRPGAPNRVQVDPPKALVRPGETQQFSAEVVGPDGAPRPDLRVGWKVHPPGLGTITPAGLFTAGTSSRLGAVIALVPPDQGGGRGTAGVAVSSYAVRIDGVRPRHVDAGQPEQFTAAIRDAGGNPVSNAILQWSRSSASPGFGSIDPASGLFTAGQPLASQVEGFVYVRVLLNGLVIGGDGLKVVVHRR